jgi:transcription initiation factor TFIID subunit TAF12
MFKVNSSSDRPPSESASSQQMEQVPCRLTETPVTWELLSVE